MYVLDRLSLDEASVFAQKKYLGSVWMTITRREWDFVSRTERHLIRRKICVL